MNQAFYAHMNNKKMKKKKTWCGNTIHYKQEKHTCDRGVSNLLMTLLSSFIHSFVPRVLSILGATHKQRGTKYKEQSLGRSENWLHGKGNMGTGL
jgi:hypothetical protein